MTAKDHASTDAIPVDAQKLKKGTLTQEEKLDIGIEGSMMTSEPPQVSEPKTAAAEEADAQANPGK